MQMFNIRTRKVILFYAILLFCGFFSFRAIQKAMLSTFGQKTLRVFRGVNGNMYAVRIGRPSRQNNITHYVRADENTTNILPLNRNNVVSKKKRHFFEEESQMHTQKDCGDVCNTSMPGVRSKFFPYIKKQVKCDALWTNKHIDASRKIGPAPSMPHYLRKHYTYSSQVPIQNYSRGLLNQQYAGAQALTPVWTAEHIDAWSKKCAEGTLKGNYGTATTQAIFHSLQKIPLVQGGNVLVVGSENPWIESCVLQAGASHITTLEYGAIESRHARISTLTPDQARIMYQQGTLGPFDVIVSFSSVEHSGLGRYGDALNPWGDLQAVARMWCVCKSMGYLLLGVMEGSDAIVWNAHRQYGPIMFPHLAANWRQKWREGHMPQRVYVFQKDMIQQHYAEYPQKDNSNISGLSNDLFSVHNLHIPTGMQQHISQVEITVAEILKVRHHKGHCNLLVFGLGYDSPFWRDINVHGTTIFLEDSQTWIDEVKKRHGDHLEVIKVTYETQIERDRQKFEDPASWPRLRMVLPNAVEAIEWDIVMVDAPMGFAEYNPGRWQSIYTAAHLRRPIGSLTVIDDCERQIENNFGCLVFGKNNLKRRIKRPRTSHAAANEQCYFWGSTESTFSNQDTLTNTNT